MLLPKQKNNLITNGWDSFEPVGNKPNLIPNGWDSFNPYGSGKNYVENWDFTKEIIDHISHWQLERTVKDNVLRFYGNTENERFFQFEYDDKSTQDMILRFKYRSSSDCATREFANSNIVKQGQPIVKSENWNIYEYQFNRLSGTEELALLRFFVKPTEWIEIDWVQITPVDNQHLVVEKTPLENGLTHIQTWGGTADIKLKTEELPNDIEENSPMVYSFYIENNGKDEVRFLNNWSISGEPYPEGAEYMIVVPINYKGMAYLKGSKAHGKLELNVRSSGGINIVASEPQIVESDKPNLTVLKEDLGNSLTRIRTFGGQEESKLRFEKPFDNEDLTFSTYLENVGEEPLGIKSFDNKTEYYEPDFKGMVEQHGKG